MTSTSAGSWENLCFGYLGQLRHDVVLRFTKEEKLYSLIKTIGYTVSTSLFSQVIKNSFLMDGALNKIKIVL